MSGIYRVGQKVTPADHHTWYTGDGSPGPDPRCLPQYGGAYTVEKFYEHRADGIPGIILREFPGFSFQKSAFRPLVDESVRRSVSFVTPTPVDA